MGDIRFRCPGCDAKLVIDSQAEGYHTACPQCEKKIKVPKPPERREGEDQIKFYCKKCDAKLAIAREAGGYLVDCPHCGECNQVPDLLPVAEELHDNPSEGPASITLTKEEVDFLISGGKSET